MTWLEKYYETIIESGYYKLLLEGFGNTLLITIGALIIGVIIGTILSVTKYFCEDVPAMKPICWLCDLYITVIRGIPVTVLLLVFFYIIFVSVKDGVPVAIIAFGINSGAYMAELIRSGINAVDKGQMEAARSLGLSKGQAMAKIIFPQAIKNILPAIANEFVVIIKESSICYTIGVQDLMFAVDAIRGANFIVMEPLLVATAIYFCLCFPTSKLIAYFERKMSRGDKR